MIRFKPFQPAFWNLRADDSGPFRTLFNLRRIWHLAVLLTACVAIIPLVLLAAFDINVTKRSTENEINLRVSKLVSNTASTLSFFLEERRFALKFIVHEHPIDTLLEPGRLAALLANFNKTIGGITDLSVIDSEGVQVRYAGPYDLEGRNYRNEPWFQEVLERGHYISDVFLGFRETPHLVISVKHVLPDGSHYLFRATLDTERFSGILSQLVRSASGDMFLINRDGIIQTPSINHGQVLERFPLPVPEYSTVASVYEQLDADGRRLVSGYAYIADSPFILMVLTEKDEMMKSWRQTRFLLVVFTAISIALILIVIVGVATRLVNQIHLADQKRILTLREVEHSAKLASIGRLAAGVAHEINNPLAIIGEKAGLMKDLLRIEDVANARDRLISLAGAVQSSVERCGAITKRLLGFAQHLAVSIESVDIKEVIEDVLAFLGKEAEYRSMQVSVRVTDDIPEFLTDRGKLQQIFLNLVNNAFSAMDDGGHLDISAFIRDDGRLAIRFADDGCGIPEDNLERIFEPFFSTRKDAGGTGLGLSITYGLVEEIGGSIHVESKPGEGTRFTVLLPLRQPTETG